MLLVGGWNPGDPGSGGIFLDSVYLFDLKDLSSQEMAPVPGGPVSRHAACTVGNRVVVITFRGVLVWDGEGDSLREQPTTGEGPEGLSMWMAGTLARNSGEVRTDDAAGHFLRCAVTALGGSELLVFGGSTREQRMSSDAFVLDTESWAWRKLKVAPGSAAPTPRASSCAAPVDADRCVVFGGAGLGGDGYDARALGLSAAEAPGRG